MANLFFKLLTSSRNFGVLVCVVGFLDHSIDDPISCTNMLPNSNSNGTPSLDFGLLPGTYISNGMYIVEEGCVSILSVSSLITCRPSCVCCCCDCCRYNYWKCCGLAVVSIQSSYTSSSMCKCSSPSITLVSCSLLLCSALHM
jgi:hypothetical protein